MSALLPCECGRIPTILRRTRLRGGRFQVDELWVECTPCGARGSTYHSDDQPAAIAAWNQRATPADVAALRGEVERLRGALEWYADPVLPYAITQAREPRSAVHADGGKRARAALAQQEPTP